MDGSPVSSSGSTSPAAPGQASSQAQAGALDDQLVKLIADRVYQRLLQELQVEHERLRLVTKKTLASRFRKGGR